MDKMTPMDPEYQETPPEWQPGTPGYYGTGRLPKPPRSHTGLIVVLLCVMIVANVITVLMLLTLRMRAVQKNTTVGAETETDVTPTLTAPSGHSVEPTEPRTNGTGTLQISAEDTQTRSAGEIYTALRPSLAPFPARRASRCSSAMARSMRLPCPAWTRAVIWPF